MGMPQLRERSAADDVAEVRGDAEPPATPDGVPVMSPAEPTPRLVAEPPDEDDDDACEAECAEPPLRDGALAAVEVVPVPEERGPPPLVGPR